MCDTETVKNEGQVETEDQGTCTEDSCSHEWVFDLIDIDPDRSMHITYCVLCEKTK